MMRIAQEKGILNLDNHDLRDWTHDKHRTTDDYPYGGGAGLVMKCEPVFEALESILNLEQGQLPDDRTDAEGNPLSAKIVFMSPHGRPFDDRYACELSKEDHLVFICGHYEGMDERVYSLADELISIGDYVLTSGELASMVVIDAVVRKIPGVLGAEAGSIDESFADGLLEYPQYTRPASFRGMDVPEVLLSGHHKRIEEWRHEKALEATFERRPDLLMEYIDGDSMNLDDCDIIESFLE